MTEWMRHAQFFLHFQSSKCMTMRGEFTLSVPIMQYPIIIVHGMRGCGGGDVSEGMWGWGWE